MENLSELHDTYLDKNEVVMARTAQRCIITSLDHSKAVSIALLEEGVERLDDASPILRLPPKVLRLFADMLGAMAQGKSVTIVPREMHITTQEAAMFLNVSRPYLIKLLEEGKIAYHKVGRHRRILFEDLIVYKEHRHKKSQTALEELSAQAQELGMGY